jgi:hypothetical protein
MSPSAFTDNATPHPLPPLAELFGPLVSVALHLIAALAIGLVGAHFMRRRHLRWTWAVSLLPLVVIARTVLTPWTTALGGACLYAAALGRHWHREDMLAGDDLAEIARRRRGPLRCGWLLLRACLARARGTQMRQWLRGGRLIVARRDDGKLVSVPFGGVSGARHTLIVGTTGSGKTYTQAWVLTHAIRAGMGAVAIDPKGDPRLRAQIESAARAVGKPFIAWTPHGPNVYNPFAGGSVSVLADKALAGEHFTEPHYQRQAQRYLGQAIRAMRDAGATVSLRALVEHLEPDRLEVLARTLPAERAQATHDYLDALTPRQRTDLTGIRDRLAIMAESDLAPWLDPDTPGGVVFDLLAAIREQAVVYFDLEADSWPLLARMLAGSILQDLQTTVSALQGHPVPTLVAIDEFSAIASGHVERLFGRARSAGVSLLLGTQELSDLRLDRGDLLLERVLGNLTTIIAHRQVVPRSAELIAELAGRRGAWRGTDMGDGRWTRTRSSVPLLDAREICTLPPGWAAIVELGAHAEAQIARIFSSGEPPHA